MREVELTSEFVIVMLQGISAKTPTILNKLYQDYDVNFAQRNEVTKRFAFVMDSLDDSLGDDDRMETFQSVTLFYGLFSVFYDIHYGIGSPLTAMRPRTISSHNLVWLGTASTMILKRLAPEDVVSAYLQNTTNLDSRMRLYNYLRNPQGDKK